MLMPMTDKLRVCFDDIVYLIPNTFSDILFSMFSCQPFQCCKNEIEIFNFLHYFIKQKILCLNMIIKIIILSYSTLIL